MFSGIVNQYVRILGTILAENLGDYIRVESAEDPYTLVLKDGSLMSMIRVSGALKAPGTDEMEDIVEQMRIALSPYLALPGHVIEISFLRDPQAAQRDLREMVNRTSRSALNLGLDVEDVLEERIRTLSDWFIDESCIFTIYTRPNVLTREEMKDDILRLNKETAEMPPMRLANKPSKSMDAVVTRHRAFAQALHRTFKKVGQIAEIIDIDEVLREIRAGLYPETRPDRRDWSPRHPDWVARHMPRRHDKARKSGILMMPETESETKGRDFSHMFPPSYDRQLAEQDAMVVDNRIVRVGDRIHTAFDMTLAPETLPRFNDLVSDISGKNTDMPWRASIRFESGGLQAMQMKSFFLSVFTFSAPGANRRIRDVISGLREIDGQEDTVIKFRMSFSTWAEIGSENALRRNVQSLSSAVRRWGNSRVDGLSGDPLATLVSTAPGLTTSSTAPVAAAPLGDALAMTPLARPASPWEHGSILYRTDDGRPWPFQPGSSRQSTWVTLICGTPGSGKSVAMNAINFASALTPNSASGGTPSLPRIAIIDIGYSSAGVISLLQEALPADRRHEVMFRKLKMSPDHAINVFDTQIGARYPMVTEKTFLQNFISMICSDADGNISRPMRGMIKACINQAYIMLSDQEHPKRYMPEENTLVDRAMEETGFEDVDGNVIWWDVVDHLFSAGRIYEAEIAQRYAVPTLNDLVTASNQAQVKASYGTVMDSDTQQTLIESFSRTISEAVRDYPILASHTRFSLGSSRVVALDLQDVTVRSGSKAAAQSTSMMYMLARQVMTRDFYLDEEDIISMVEHGHIPRIYEDHHVERARTSLQTPKIFCMDEFHRTGKSPMICDQVLVDAREGRKFNVDLKIASQLITDFPRDVVEIASGMIVCNAGSQASIGFMDEILHLSDYDKYVMSYELNGPSSNGAPLWVMYNLKSEGQVRQKVNLTLGPAEIWAFSTTSEDVALRNSLYESIGPRLTRKILSLRFPSGSAKPDIETRIRRFEESGKRIDEGGRGNVIQQLAAEMQEQAFRIGT